MRLRRAVTTSLFVLATVVGAGDASGQEPLNSGAAERLLKFGYTWRREGNYDAASGAFRNVLPSLQGDARKRLVREMCEMYVVQGKYEKAIRFYLDEKMNEEALAVMAKGERTDQVTALCKKMNNPLAEGRALEALGQNDAALAAYEKAQAHKERGDLLLKLQRPKDAVQAYEAAKNDYLRAVALDAAGDAAGAKAAFEAAKAPEKAALEKLLAEARDVKKKYEASNEQVERERLRYELAGYFGQVSRAYDRLSLIHERTGDAVGAANMLEVAQRIGRAERDTLTDVGADKWGQAKAKQLDLDARLDRLGERLVPLRKAAGDRIDKANDLLKGPEPK